MITREIQFEKPEDDEFGDEDEEDDGIVIEASNEKGKLYTLRPTRLLSEFCRSSLLDRDCQPFIIFN